MDKAVIDLGTSEATAGLTFVCLSCAKRLGNLLIAYAFRETFETRRKAYVLAKATKGSAP